MRPLVLAALGLVLAHSAARAEDRPTKPRLGKVGLRVVQVFPDTQQALVLNLETGKHVVVGEGDHVGKYDVVEVGDDEVVVRLGTRELVLVVTSPTPGAVAPVADGPARPIAPGLLDPYAPVAAPSVGAPSVGAPSVGAGPLDPYAISAPVGTVREVLAPAGARAGVLDPYAAPGTPAVVTPAVVTPAVVTPAVVTPAVGPRATGVTVVPTNPVEAAPATGVDAIRADAATIKRSELSASLADFDKLAKDVGFVKTPDGVRLTTIRAGSFFYGLGFRSGDVVTAIDGAPMRSIDDAAPIYIKLGSAKKLEVAIARAGARGTLRFALK